MGKRGPAPLGEYSDKTQVLSTRISSELRASLVAAAKNSGGTLSREVEHRLRRTFTDDKNIVEAFESRRNYALMKLIASIIEATVNLKRQNIDWLDDPYAFDQVTQSVTAVLEAIRPPDEVPSSTENVLDLGGKMQGKVNAFEALRAIQVADAKLPLTKGARHQHIMTRLKSDIGDVADRAVLYGRTADNTRKLGELGQRFIPLMQKAEKTPEAMTTKERQQLDALVHEIAALQSPIIDQNTMPRKRK